MDRIIRQKTLGLEPETARHKMVATLTLAQIVTLDKIIKAIKYGSGVTLTSVVAKLSTVAGTAFISNPTFTYTGLPSNDLSWLDGTGWKVNFNDGSKNAYLYAKAKGTGETLDDNIVTNGDMELDANWDSYGTPTTNERSNEQAHGGTYSRKLVRSATASGARQPLTTVVGTLYQCDGWVYLSSGTRGYINFIVAGGYQEASGSWGEKIHRGTATETSHYVSIIASSASGATAYFDDVSVKQILTPSASGLTGTSTAGGATYNWASIEADFNPNVASFSVTITRS